jgi:hypothetical protein
MTEECSNSDGPRHVVTRHALIKGKIVSRLRRAQDPPANIEKLANKLATELSQVRKPANQEPDAQRSYIEALTRTACDRLNAAGVSGGEIYEIASGILEAVGCSFAKRPSGGFWFGPAVDDYLCPPCDADFEYLSESDD